MDATTGSRPPLPRCPTVARRLRRALEDRSVAALWQGSNADRSYLSAALALAPPHQLRPELSAHFYDRVCHQPRRAVLSELAGVPVSAAGLRCLVRVDDGGLRAKDRRSLILHLEDKDTQRALGHLTRITVALVRQLDHIPTSLRAPALLATVQHIPIAPERWQCLGDALESIDVSRRLSLLREGRRVTDAITLWTFLRHADGMALEARPFPLAPDLAPWLDRLGDAAAMRREGLTMRNCLGELVRSATRGDTAYYSFTGSERATVELRSIHGAWHLHRVLGAGNYPLTEGTANALHSVLRRMGVVVSIETAGCGATTDSLSLEEGATIGRARFSAEARAAVAATLRSIRGHSDGHRPGGYCIFEYTRHPYFVQACWLPDGSFAAEVVSHHYVPHVAKRLTEARVAFLERAGFDWSAGNFARMVPSGDDDVERLADFFLGTLHFVFGYSEGRRLSTKTNLTVAT